MLTGTLIRVVRSACDLTLDEMSERTNLSKSLLSAMETGTKRVSKNSEVALLKAFEEEGVTETQIALFVKAIRSFVGG